MQHNEDTTNKRTRLNEQTLEGSIEILQGIINACNDVQNKKCSFSQACRMQNLDPLYTRWLILNFLGKCRDKRVDLSTLEFDFVDGYEQFYQNVFGEHNLTVSKLPIDYKETVQYVINETGLSEREIWMLTCHYQFDEGNPMTMKSIGNSIGISRGRVQQIMSAALRKCRLHPRCDILQLGLTAYRQKRKQDEELAELNLKQAKAAHEALMDKTKEEIKTQAKQITKCEDVLKELSHMPIEVLKPSTRVRNALNRASVDTIFELMKKTPDDFMRISNLGQKSIEEIEDKLETYIESNYGVNYPKLKEFLNEAKGVG